VDGQPPRLENDYVSIYNFNSGEFGCSLKKPGYVLIRGYENEDDPWGGPAVFIYLIIRPANWDFYEYLPGRTMTLMYEGYEWEQSVSLKPADGGYKNRDFTYTIESSDPSVVTASWPEDEEEVFQGEEILVEAHKIGTAKITITDQFGQSKWLQVKATAPPLKFSSDTRTTLTYDEYGGEEEWISLDESCVTHIASFKTNDNGKVIKVTGEKSDDGYYYDLIVSSVGRGEAKLTVTDELGQTKTLTFKVVPFLDQSYFETENSTDAGSYDSKAVYGDTKLTFHCNEPGVRVSFTLNGKSYFYTMKTTKVTMVVPRITDDKVTVRFYKDGGEYFSTATVSRKPASALKASAKSVTYNGKAQKPKIIVKDGSYTLKKGTDFTVKYKGNKNIGKGTATITFKGHYKGTKKARFEVMPKGTSISKLKAGKKSLTVVWKKNKSVNGYDIEYSNQKNFKNVADGKDENGCTIEYRGHKVTDRMFDGLKSGKTYYVRVRTFKKVKGSYIYSNWSKVKKVKVK